MKILLIYPDLKMGGIQTLIVRMLGYFSEMGHEASLLLERNDSTELYFAAAKYGKIICLPNILYLPTTILKKHISSDIDIIYCFDGLSLITGHVLKQRYLTESKILAGVYHAREYSMCSNRYVEQLVAKIFAALPDENIVFMNEATKHEHAIKLSRGFSNSPIVPIPVKLDVYQSIKRSGYRNKIVSIGRITDFKTYNFYMVDVIHQLIHNGHDVEYHIYGNGNEFDKLNKYVALREMSSYVFLHGTLDYTKIPAVLSDAIAFVGMGTALIEASACGVPAIIAIESNSTPTTYGFLHETTGYHVGEVLEHKNEVLIYDKIECLLKLSALDYEQEVRKSRIRANDFSLPVVMQDIIEAFIKSRTHNFMIMPNMLFMKFIDKWLWRILKLAKVRDPLKNKYLK